MQDLWVGAEQPCCHKIESTGNVCNSVTLQKHKGNKFKCMWGSGSYNYNVMWLVVREQSSGVSVNWLQPMKLIKHCYASICQWAKFYNTREHTSFWIYNWPNCSLCSFNLLKQQSTNIAWWLRKPFLPFTPSIWSKEVLCSIFSEAHLRLNNVDIKETLAVKTLSACIWIDHRNLLTAVSTFIKRCCIQPQTPSLLSVLW